MVHIQKVLENMKACVVIPAYNEAKTIGSLVKDIRRRGLDVVVADDASKDGTARIAQENGAVVITNNKNLGKGGAQMKGFDYALKNGFDAIVTMDGDGQHLTEDLPVFLSHAESSSSSIFIGNRMFDTKDMPPIRTLTNKAMSWLISLIAKQHIPDTQCGFRLFKKLALQKIKLSAMKFEADSEILIKGSRAGLKIESVPITTVYRDEKSHINPFTDTIRFLGLIIRLWITRG